jgi:hypothetical protein
MSQIAESTNERTRTHGANSSAVAAPLADVLTPKLSAHWALDGRHLLLAAGFALLFMHHNYLPLFHSDIWGHVAYGNWILDHRALPAEEPFVSLAEGVPVVDTAWLGQVLFALAGRSGDPEGYSHLFALTVLAGSLVLMRALYLQTRSAGLAACGAWLAWALGFSRHAVIRPEAFGVLCFAALWWLVVRTDERRSRGLQGLNESCLGPRWLPYALMPLLFGLWANLHGSFIVGFAVLGSYAAGRACEVLWKRQSATAVLNDARFRRWVILGELAVLGTLANPYGIDLLLNTVLFPSNPNLKDVLEWYPLDMASLEAVPMAVSWVLLLAVWRHSRTRVALSDVLVLAVFTLAVCLRVRMISWYTPTFVVVLSPHIAELAARLWTSPLCEAVRRQAEPLFRPSFRLTLLAGLLVWLTFAFSPISRPVLGGKARPPERLYSNDTPLGITRWLREHPPQGMVANPQWWGDWIVWDGPPGIEVMMTTNSVHVVPQRAWKDYLAIAQSQPGLSRRLHKYRANTIIVCKELQAGLERTVRAMPDWQVVYEDDIGLVAVRTGVRSESGEPHTLQDDEEPGS